MAMVISFSNHQNSFRPCWDNCSIAWRMRMHGKFNYCFFPLLHLHSLLISILNHATQRLPVCKFPEHLSQHWEESLPEIKSMALGYGITEQWWRWGASTFLCSSIHKTYSRSPRSHCSVSNTHSFGMYNKLYEARSIFCEYIEGT